MGEDGVLLNSYSKSNNNRRTVTVQESADSGLGAAEQLPGS